MSNLKILGIDPGYDIVGWSILSNNFKVDDYGVIKTSPTDEFDDRLLQIFTSLNKILDEYKPDCAAIEKIFFHKNTKTAIPVAKAVGVIILTLKLRGIPYWEYSPIEVKHSITGYGRASKDQIYYMMKRILNLKTVEWQDDAIDALSIAVCHQLKNKKLKKQTTIHT
ncbi:MAG: crossover junction endodeoxyribonuclease RuvC [Spirochaetes bacterium]|nr:crossover junction endodeoxyribonuclease RuvC [Spirochaetota bacterium]